MAKMQSLRTAQTHQAEINKKIKANDKLRKILTNMPEEHRVLIYGDSFKSKMQSLDDEKAASLAAKRQFGSKNKKNYLERVSKEIESTQKKRLEILQTWLEADQDLEAANSKQIQAKHEMAMLVAEQTAENAKLSIKEIQGSRLTRQDPFLIKLHNKPFSQCSNPFSRCKAWSATVFRNSSWRLARLRRMSGKSVRLWHRQCGNWKQGTRHQNLVPRRTAFRAKWWARTKSFQGSMRTWIQQTGHRGPRSHQEEPVKWHHRKEAIGKEMQTGRRRFVTFSVSGSGLNSLQCPFNLRFPELVKRVTQDLHAPQRSCSATNSKQLASGLRI